MPDKQVPQIQLPAKQVAETPQAPTKALPVDAVQAELEAIARQTFELERQVPGGLPVEGLELGAELQQLEWRVQWLEREVYGAGIREGSTKNTKGTKKEIGVGRGD